MRTALAERLLAKIMNWSPEQVQMQRPLLQALANFKFDEYQQYAPGIRFMESLVRWLRQFEQLNEREAAYDFFLKHLIFISGDQMAYLVSLAYYEKVKPKIIEKTAAQLRVSKYCVRQIEHDAQYVANLRQSLFIGLSDGAKIDLFRRVSGISNEQVSTTYHLSDEKVNDLQRKLREEVGHEHFTTIFLIDDFTASGRSFFRPEEESGKLIKFINALREHSGEQADQNALGKLVNLENLTIHVLFYVATSEAISTMRASLQTWLATKQLTLRLELDAVQLLDDTVRTKVLADHAFMAIARKYFDAAVLTTSYRMGKHEAPYLGFNECALPVVLNHNTPNNTLPILWFDGGEHERKGLFPRIARHKL